MLELLNIVLYCVILCVAICYTIYITLCYVTQAVEHLFRPFALGVKNAQDKLTFSSVFPGYLWSEKRCLNDAVRARCPKRHRQSPSTLRGLAYNFPSSCYMLGGPKGTAVRAVERLRNRSAFLKKFFGLCLFL